MKGYGIVKDAGTQEKTTGGSESTIEKVIVYHVLWLATK